MKILLIYPRPLYPKIPRGAWVPLGLSFIASSLRQHGNRVSIFDRFAYQSKTGNDRPRLDAVMEEQIRAFGPDLIGLNTVSPLIYDTVACVNLIRQSFSGPIVAGGHHATALPQSTLLKIPGLDAVVEGEGEGPMVQLAAGVDPAQIPGLWWRRDGGKIVHSPPAVNRDLDRLPFPAFDLLDMAFYTRPGKHTIRGRSLRTLSLLTSRGCVRRCDFCTESLTYGAGVRYHTPEYVLNWIEHALGQYPVQGIYFHDNDFLIDEPRARAICEGMLSRGIEKRISWSIQTRVDRVGPGILRLLKKAGCVAVEMGIESALQEELDSVHKGTTVELNEKAISLCRREGLSVQLYMMTGFEGETINDLERKLEWIKKIKPNTFYWFPLQIHPGTALYDRKGSRFFEESEWTEREVSSYYERDLLTSILPEERKAWLDTRYAPFHRRHRWLSFLKVNSPRDIVRFLWDELTAWIDLKKPKKNLDKLALRK
jgi:anaerobic magnesium-protoporphyrin IX monomethyl ester cyclase